MPLWIAKKILGVKIETLTPLSGEAIAGLELLKMSSMNMQDGSKILISQKA